MEQRIPDAGLVTLAGAGHFAFAEQWGLCSRVLDSFLKG
jgi:pimeloyl-ACP methyl ester carboxylesterase